MYVRALRKRLQHIVFIHEVDIRWNTPGTILQLVTDKKYVKKKKPLRHSVNDGNRNTFLDFYTFSVLSTFFLGPKIVETPVANKQVKKGRCKHDVIVLVSVLRRMIAESASSNDRGKKVFNEFDID